MKVRSFDLNGDCPEFPPDLRRRLDDEAMAERDVEVTRLRRAGVMFRVIAARLGMSLGSVQKSVRRTAEATPPPVRRERIPRHGSRFRERPDGL